MLLTDRTANLTVIDNPQPRPVTPPAVDHPTWCDRRSCDTRNPRDARHSSEANVWRPAEDDVDITLTQVVDVERDLSGALVARHHGVKLNLENVMSVLPGGCPVAADVYLRPEDADHLALLLTAYAARARRAAKEDAR